MEVAQWLNGPGSQRTNQPTNQLAIQLTNSPSPASAAQLGLQGEPSLLTPDVRLVLEGRLVQLEAPIHRLLGAAGPQALHLDGPHRPEAAGDADSDDDDAIASGSDDTKDPVIDPERDEALNILADLVDLSRGPKTASATPVSTPVP